MEWATRRKMWNGPLGEAKLPIGARVTANGALAVAKEGHVCFARIMIGLVGDKNIHWNGGC